MLLCKEHLDTKGSWVPFCQLGHMQSIPKPVFHFSDLGGHFFFFFATTESQVYWILWRPVMKNFSESERDKINPEPSIYPFAQDIATATDQHFIPSGCVYSMKVGWLYRFGQGYDINSFHMGAEPLWDCNFYFQTGSYSAAPTGLELMTIFLPQPSGCWDYRYKPSHWDYNLIFWAVIWFFFAILILDLPYKVTKSRLIQKFFLNF